MKIRAGVDLIIIVLMALVLIAMTHEFNRAAHYAEGRIGTLERIVSVICTGAPEIDRCDVLLSN